MTSVNYSNPDKCINLLFTLGYKKFLKQTKQLLVPHVSHTLPTCIPFFIVLLPDTNNDLHVKAK
jgi:hypothetical protein